MRTAAPIHGKSIQDSHKKAEQQTIASNFDSHPQLVKPVGVFESEGSKLSGKRYADRAEGIDQFGGEESERQSVHDDEVQSGSGGLESLRKYDGNPGYVWW